jgi:hypothetical protein
MTVSDTWDLLFRKTESLIATLRQVKAGCLKRRSATGILCNRNMPLCLKGKFYRTVVRLALLYSMEY